MTLGSDGKAGGLDGVQGGKEVEVLFGYAFGEKEERDVPGM